MANQANPTTIDLRKVEASELAARKGHVMGNWVILPGTGPVKLEAKCLIGRCNAAIVLSTEVHGTYAGHAAFNMVCPYQK